MEMNLTLKEVLKHNEKMNEENRGLQKLANNNLAELVSKVTHLDYFIKDQ